MNNTAIIIFRIPSRQFHADVEVPLDITANELVTALNQAYALNIDISDVKKCYLKSENPIALIKGNNTLAEFGIRNGTVVYCTGNME